MPDLDLVAQRVRSVCGEVSELTRLDTWGSSVVVRCQLDSGQVVYKSGGDGSIPGEAAALRLAGEHGLLVPALRELVCDATIAGGGWMVMTAIPGTPWNLEPVLASPAQAEIGRERLFDDLAATFAGLHHIRGEGAGPVGADGGGQYDNWASWLAAEVDRLCPRLLTVGALDTSEVAVISGFFTARRHWFATRPVRLLHGDLGDGEIIVDADGGLAGVVDFGRAVWGDPVFDFAHFVGGGPVDDPRPSALLPAVMERYWRMTDYDPGWPTFFAAYLAFNDLRNLNWCVDEGIVDWIPGLRSDLLTQVRLAGG